MKNILYGLAFVSILSACDVSKNIDMPKPALPGTFRSAAITSDTTSIADIQWKEFFADPTLRQLIDSAIQRNYDMQLAVKNLEESQLVVSQVKWNNVPVVALNVTASTYRPSDNSLDGLSLQQDKINTSYIQDYSANVSVSWEADIWGKIHNQKKEAVAQYLQTVEAKKAVQTKIVANVSQGYYNLLMLDAQLAIARQNVKLNDSTLRIIRFEYDAGQVTSLAIEQAQAQQLTAAQLVPQFEQNIAIQENALRILTGDLPGSIQRSSTLDQVVLPANLSSGIPSALVSRRPDVKSAELSLEVANAQVGITRAGLYPVLNITATGGVNSFMANDWFNIPASIFGMVAGSVLQPILQHKELKTKYETAEVDREKVVIQFRQTVLNAVGEVSDALVQIDKLKAQQNIVQTQVNTLNQATKNANLLFKNGMANYLEVITAQSSVLQSQLELATIKRDELTAVSDLYVSLGGGWR